jgi:purine-nucleoside phosphorylase
MLTKINEATDFLASRFSVSPQIGMITGTGLGSLTENMKVDFRVLYKEIPNFPTSTVEGHKGTLALGKISDKTVIAMEGRFHLYEGYTPYEVTFPIRVMAKLGIKYLFISSAAGGLNPEFKPGSLMVVTDHINLTGTNPLISANIEAFGPRFPDMSRAYDPDLIDIAKIKARHKKITLNNGVYVGITGPSLETPAETRFLRMIGADAVGMSTVSEVIAGAHSGLKIMVIVVITNVNLPEKIKKVSIDEVIANANLASPTLSRLWESIIADLPE